MATIASIHKMSGRLLEALANVRKTDASTTRKPGRLLEALDKVRKADVAETTTRKPSRLEEALQKVKETYAAEAEAVAVAPRGVKAFTRMKAAAAEAEAISAEAVVDRLKRRESKMPVLTADVVKPKSPAPVEVKLPILTEPEKDKEEKKVRVMTPRMQRLVVEMSAQPVSPRTVLPFIKVRREVTLVHADDDSRTWRVSYVECKYK